MGLPAWENPRLVSRLFLKNPIKNSLTFLKAEKARESIWCLCIRKSTRSKGYLTRIRKISFP